MQVDEMIMEEEEEENNNKNPQTASVSRTQIWGGSLSAGKGILKI